MPVWENKWMKLKVGSSILAADFEHLAIHNLGGCMMLGLIKCRICDEDIDVYDAEKVIIHYSTCAKCKSEVSDTSD
jgi:hypothetical protein